jgi:limonene-1,2-epoxide hydrolase
MQPALDAICVYFETLRREDLARIDRIYTDDACFKDPFNEVQGRAAIARIFEHMFDTLAGPHFVIRERLLQGQRAFLAWDFVFRRGGAPFVIRGASHLELADDGRIARHRDYWDAAEELYAKLPVLGALMRWLRRRLSAR